LGSKLEFPDESEEFTAIASKILAGDDLDIME